MFQRKWALRGLFATVAVLLALWAGNALRGRVEAEIARKGCRNLPTDTVPLALPGPETPAIRFVALGDQGSADDAERAVADGIRRVCAGRNCDFLLLLGDSFYPDGLDSPQDPLIDAAYEDILGALGLPALPVLGNHDVHKHPLPLVLHSLSSDTWRMPNYSYAFRAGPARFVALNTNCSLVAWQSVGEHLADPGSMTAPWRIVFGHHSVYSNGPHGDIDTMSRWTWRRAAAGRVDFYLAGHNHVLEHLRADGDATEYIVSGAGSVPGAGQPQGGHTTGGQDAPPGPKPSQARSLFRLDDGGGFVWFELTKDKAIVRYHGADGRILYSFETTPEKAG